MTYAREIGIPTYSPLGVRNVAKTAKRWFALFTERRALQNLTLSQLEDMGITEAAAKSEAARPFWSSDAR